MVQISKVGPGTEAGKQLLDDFKNWRQTGFKPWGKGVGGAAHYQTRKMYQVVTKNAFRSQAKKIAKIALEQMPAQDIPDEDATDDDIDLEEDQSCEDQSLPQDSENKNPWQRNLFESGDDDEDSEDNDDEFIIEESDDETRSDCLEGFDEIQLGELQNARAPIVVEYPSSNKLLLVFALDGNVGDMKSNEFEFSDGNTTIKRWAKVPRERMNPVALIGNGTEKRTTFGFSDVDLMLVEAEINRRLKVIGKKKDHKGDIWEVRDSVRLPFPCEPVLYSKKGVRLDTYRLRSNSHGFSWAYFWLLKPQRPQARPSKRIGGQKVSERDDSSIFTEKTFHSRRGCPSEIRF